MREERDQQPPAEKLRNEVAPTLGMPRITVPSSPVTTVCVASMSVAFVTPVFVMRYWKLAVPWTGMYAIAAPIAIFVAMRIDGVKAGAVAGATAIGFA